MVQTQLITRVDLKLDGNPASQEIRDSLIFIEVDDSLLLPDMFTIHLRDPEVRWIDADVFAIGKPVDISVKNGGGEVKLISGEITAIDPRFNPTTGPTLVLRGYDLSHRLNRDKKTRSFVQMTDSDIAEKIAKEAHLKTKIDATRQVHQYVLQDNKTDWELLIARAQRIGYRVLVKGNKFYFVKTPASSGNKPVVEWTVDLLEFNARMSTTLQVSEVIVHGWDPDIQKQIVGRATVAQDVPAIGETRSGGQAAEQAFSVTAKQIVVDRPVATQSEADALAQSVCNEIGQGFIEAEGVCFGNPAVQSGALVEIKGVGQRFSGTYRVTHTRHRYDASGYFTEFTLGGRHSSSLIELLTPTKQNLGKGPGPVLGVVTNNNDPDGLARVKVKIPSLADSHESHWARLVSPGAGREKGFVWIPDVGDEVLVLFEHEDIHYPLVIGGLWSQRAKPVDGHNLVDSGKGSAIHIDTHEKMGMAIMDKPNDTSLRIGDTDNHVLLSKTNREALVKSADKVTIEGMNISVDANSSVEIKSNGNIKIEATGTVEIKGAMIKLN